MADGQQKIAWTHTLAIGIMFNKAMGGKGPPILELIPKRYRRDPKLAAADEEANSELAFAELEAGLKALSATQREPTIAGFKRRV